MAPITTIILPGMDGTDLLLDEFCRLAPPTHKPIVYPLPDDPEQTHEHFCDYFSKKVIAEQECHVIAESFSGPIGILLALRHPDKIKWLTLVASFATSPTFALAKLIPWSNLFQLPLPSFIAKTLLLGGDSIRAQELKKALELTSARILAARMRAVLNVDVSKELQQLECDLKYIRPTADRLVSGRSSDEIVRLNSRFSINEIAGPHLILQTRPKECWTAIAG